MMRSLLTAAVLLGAGVDAFPRAAMHAIAQAQASPFAARAASKAQRVSPPQGTGGALPATPPPFDAASQLVSVEGVHKWVEPTATDQRGECPGLNAMANHGYLPHSGIGTIQDFSNACQEVYGMSPELATFLAIYGAVVDGTLTQWSVGGTPHLGIAGAHGNYESDSSALYADLHQYGDSSMFVYEQFKTLYDMQPDAATANYNLDVLREFRKTRFDESVSNNPLFFYNVFSGTVVTQAGYTFAYRFFSNKSEEYPEGIVTKQVLRDFYSVYFGTEEKPVHKFGYERIPYNWYKRNAADEYGVGYLEADILYYMEVLPNIQLPGCNAGETNSYNSIDPAVLTNGVYTKEDVQKHPVCFGLQYTSAFLPALTSLTTELLEPLTSAISVLTKQLGDDCVAIPAVDNSAIEACPGFSLFGGPKGDIAPGAKPN